MTVEAWILASRPKTLTAAAVPVVVGTAVAIHEGGASWGPALAALLGAFAIQIGTNFANDLFDALKGADNEDRLGPVRAVQAGLLSARAMAWGTGLAFGIATLFGIYLVSVAGWPIVIIGLASVASGLAYTGGPFPLAYNGLGDVFVMVFFGFVAVAGTTYVQLLTVPPLALWAAVPVGALATAVLVVNNVRDREGDALAGKRTVVVRFGRGFGLAEYGLCLALAYAVPVGLAAAGYGPWVLLTWVTLPMAAELVRSVARDQGAPLNETLAGTARLLLFYGLLLAWGLILAD
ncbi:MAG: 1,4-dihydroxy-2-naphthoate polyprenyltransferase [Myxococcota bacterium]